MTVSSKFDRHVAPWFWIGLTVVFLISLALRFWGLHRFNTLVFDEVYYAKFASAFLQGRQEFGGHPPLSTYLIAGGIWLARHLSWGNPADSNDLTEWMLTTVSYRWFNALTGSFLPLLVAAIAYQLTQRRSYALIAGLFAAVDGLFLVESRYALNNVYLVGFGLLGHLFLLLALNAQSSTRWTWLGLAGIGFGASMGIKWNGLGFLLGAYLLWIIAWVRRFSTTRPLTYPSPTQTGPHRSPLENLTQLRLSHILCGFALMPALTYILSWFPYIQLDPSITFWQWQEKVIDYHERVGGIDAHPYCSSWYSWLFMTRPVAYFYRTATSVSAPIPVTGPLVPQNATQVIYDVHAIGNPLLWWLSSGAMLLIVGVIAYQLWSGITGVRRTTKQPAPASMPISGFNSATWTMLYLVVNWAANWLPWAKVTRCTFLYHYMGASVFGGLAIALIVDRWLQSHDSWYRTTGITIILLILAAFIFWMPLYLGLPLSPAELKIRLWFSSWI